MGLEHNRHLRIVNPAPSDDFVGRRKEAIAKVSARIRRKTSQADHLALARELVSVLALGEMGDSERVAVGDAITKAAPSFVDDGAKSNEIGIVFALGCAEAIDILPTANGAGQMAFLAAAIYSGLSYLSPLADPQREALRSEITDLARRKSSKSPIGLRTRRAVSAPVTPENYGDAIQALADNAKWDREEIDLLWWVTNDWSVVADRRVSEMAPEMACVISAIETSGLFSGPAAQAHRDIATQHVASLDEMKSPSELADATDGSRSWSRHALASALSIIKANNVIFPALGLAILDDDQHGNLDAFHGMGRSLVIRDWCRRLIDEIGLIKQLGKAVDLTQAA